MPSIDLGRVVGPQGAQGPKGETGPQGVAGPQGVSGANGITPDIQVGTVTTLTPGSNATVTRRAGSPDAAPVFDYGIPRGADSVNDGDMKSAIYDPTGKAQDIFSYCVPKTGGAFAGVVSVVSPASGSTKGLRNIYFGNGAPASSLGANGDIYFDIG